MGNYKKMMDFQGKTVVVAGGLGLIGMPVCQAFADYGARVIIADINKKKFEAFQKTNLSSGFEYLELDISRYKKIEAGIKSLFKRTRSVDAWVNLAYPRTGDWGSALKDVTTFSWDKNMQMHLGGYFWTSKLILERMKEKKDGCLINFASIYGIVGPHFDIYPANMNASPAAYAAIKAAIVNLSRYFAAFYGPYGVRVNTVCPGGVSDHQDKRFVANYSRLAPLKRMAKAHEIAVPTVFLASEGASYITGSTLMVDGGWTSW